tara:strand:- start:651 stop:1043 length:393 start_codon:yes stop_codon:yes gene_type:complete
LHDIICVYRQLSLHKRKLFQREKHKEFIIVVFTNYEVVINLFEFGNLSLVFVQLNDQSLVLSHETFLDLVIVIALVAVQLRHFIVSFNICSEDCAELYLIWTWEILYSGKFNQILIEIESLVHINFVKNH